MQKDDKFFQRVASGYGTIKIKKSNFASQDGLFMYCEFDKFD